MNDIGQTVLTRKATYVGTVALGDASVSVDSRGGRLSALDSDISFACVK